jgi:hypothetical protein
MAALAVRDSARHSRPVRLLGMPGAVRPMPVSIAA